MFFMETSFVDFTFQVLQLNALAYHEILISLHSMLQVPAWKRLLIWEMAWNWQDRSLINILTFWGHLLEIIQFLEVLIVYEIDMSIYLKCTNFHILFNCILHLTWKARISIPMASNSKNLGFLFSFCSFFCGGCNMGYIFLKAILSTCGCSISKSLGSYVFYWVACSISFTTVSS